MTVSKSSSISSPNNKNHKKSNRFDCLSNNTLDEFPLLSRQKGPSSQDVIKEKPMHSMHSVVGIPPLNLEVLVEDVPYEDESVPVTTVPVTTLEVIEEEPEVADEDRSGLLQFTQFTAEEVQVEIDEARIFDGVVRLEILAIQIRNSLFSRIDVLQSQCISHRDKEWQNRVHVI